MNVEMTARQVPIAVRCSWAKAKVSSFDFAEWRFFDVVAQRATVERLPVRGFFLALESDPGDTMQSLDQPFRRLQ